MSEHTSISAKEVFETIGHLSIQYSTFDYLVESMTFLLFPRKFRKAGVTLGQRLAFLGKQETEESQFPERFQKLKEKPLWLIEIAEKRNRLLHDQWLLNDQSLEKGFVSLIRLKLTNAGPPSFEMENYSLQAFRSLAASVGKAQCIVAEIIGHGAWVETENSRLSIECHPTRPQADC